MDISVIVTTFNRVSQLEAALDTLIKQHTGGEFSFEIVVIDNASSDGTARLVRNLVSRSPVPLGYHYEGTPGVAVARNRGVQESRGQWLAFFDDDQLAEPDWLRGLVVVARASGAPCVGGRMRLLLPAEGRYVRLGPVCRALLGETATGRTAQPYPGKALPGTGNVLLHRSLIKDIGRFDEAFSKGCEDADYFRRIRRSGLALWYAPGAVADHVIPSYRLQREYLLWCSLRQGVGYACLDHKENSRIRLLTCCLLRVGQALLVTLPRLGLAWLKGNSARVLDQQCLLQKAVGYCRQTLLLLAPRRFPQQRFLAKLEFRGERGSF